MGTTLARSTVGIVNDDRPGLPGCVIFFKMVIFFLQIGKVFYWESAGSYPNLRTNYRPNPTIYHFPIEKLTNLKKKITAN